MAADVVGLLPPILISLGFDVSEALNVTVPLFNGVELVIVWVMVFPGDVS